MIKSMKGMAQVAVASLWVVAGAANAQVTLSNSGSAGSTTYYSFNNWSTYGSYSPRLTLSDGTSSFQAYCIDPKTGVTFPNQFSVITGLDNFFGGTTSAYATQIARTGYSGMGLSNDAATQTAVKNNLIELFSYAYNDSLLNATNAAAFGMAVWEIILQDGSANNSGTGFAYNAGRLSNRGTNTTQDNDAVEARTSAYLSALSNNTWGTGSTTGLGTATNWTYTVYYDNTSPSAQSFIRVTSGGSGGGGVPVPATLALAGLGLVLAQRARAKSAR